MIVAEYRAGASVSEIAEVHYKEEHDIRILLLELGHGMAPPCSSGQGTDPPLCPGTVIAVIDKRNAAALDRAERYYNEEPEWLLML